MNRMAQAGTGVVAMALVVLAANDGAREIFPRQWGGPNIGGGVLVLLAAVVGMVGFVLLLAGVAIKHRERRSRR